MPVWLRYLCFQVPAAIVAATGLAVVHLSLGLPRGIAIALFVAWIVKDIVLYPITRHSYAGGAPTGAERLVGMKGLTIGELREGGGYVRVNGERWRARLGPGQQALPPGARAVVTAVEGTVLVVTAAAGDEAGDADQPVVSRAKK